MDEASYDVVDGVAVFRLGRGHVLERDVQQIKRVIVQAKQEEIARLLVDVTAISFGPPSVAQRHWLMTEWASAGRGALRLALVIRPEFIDPQNFGTAVARSRGLDFRAFTVEQRAMDWLLGRHPGEPLR